MRRRGRLTLGLLSCVDSESVSVSSSSSSTRFRFRMECGTLVSCVGLAFPASFLLQKRWPYYQHLPPSLKALGIILVVVPSFVISAEHAGRRFEREQWCVFFTRN